jgi:hypothetical protein
MRIVDPMTGKAYVEKRRVRYNEPGQPRALTFSCFHQFAFLGRDRTREWFCEALEQIAQGMCSEKVSGPFCGPESRLAHGTTEPQKGPDTFSDFQSPSAERAHLPRVLAVQIGRGLQEKGGNYVSLVGCILRQPHQVGQTSSGDHPRTKVRDVVTLSWGCAEGQKPPNALSAWSHPLKLICQNPSA